MATLSETLQTLMQRARVGSRTLSKLTGIPRTSIDHWWAGTAQRPKHWRSLLQIARVLSLTKAEVDALLTAAAFPPLAALAHDIPTSHPDRQHLQPWLVAPPSEPAASPTPLLYQLRAPVADFIGRGEVIARLLAALQTAAHNGSIAAISAVRGMGGIGKTELAYLVAQRLSTIFPDAQIALNLRGVSATPLRVEQALHQVIHVFTPNAQLPDDVEALHQRYCAVLHGRRVLILADDARSAAQVRPLLPPPGCALLVTSRQRFSLPGMATIDLEQLTQAEATALLLTICDRLSAADAQRLTQACGYLPLALRISGSILQNDPALSVAGYLARLADERQRLKQLRDPDDPQVDVAASLALSYAQVDDAAQWVFRQLGVFVTDFATSLALAVVRTSGDVDIEQTLRLLLRRNLVMYDTERERWRLHDLVRDLAHSYLEAAGEWEATMWRYAQAAVQAAEEIQAQYRAGGDAVLTALARFDATRPHIDAARMWASAHAGTSDGDTLLVRGALATQLIAPLRYDRRRERIPYLERVCVAARRLGERHAEGQMLNALGSAYMELGEIKQAVRHFEQVLTIMRAIGEWRGEGLALSDVGLAYALMGQARHAIPMIERALAITQERGHRLLEGYALNTLGLALVLVGEARRAIPTIEHALTIIRTTGDQRGEGQALSNLGIAYGLIGEAHRAIPAIEHALTIARAITHRFLEGYALTSLGNAYAHMGEARRAIPTIEQALAIAWESGNRLLEGYALTSLGGTYIELGEGLRAIAALERALPIVREIGDQRGEGQALSNLGNAYILIGEPRRAVPAIEQALVIARAVAHRFLEGYALTSLGNAYLELGETQRAIACCEEALATAREVGDQREEGRSLSALGRAALSCSKLAEAMTLFDQAHAIFQKIGDRHGLAVCHWHEGLTFAGWGERQRALLLLSAAVAYEQEIGHAGAAEHTAMLACLEAGEELSRAFPYPESQRAVGASLDAPSVDTAAA